MLDYFLPAQQQCFGRTMAGTDYCPVGNSCCYCQQVPNTVTVEVVEEDRGNWVGDRQKAEQQNRKKEEEAMPSPREVLVTLHRAVALLLSRPE